jgi:hypothetical protein
VIYVFDTSALSVLFKNYDPTVFHTLWDKFDQLVVAGRIQSTREVLREIEDGGPVSLQSWAATNKVLFPAPDAGQGSFVSQIFAVKHFQQNIEQQKLLKGGNHADAFVIARAAALSGSVVATEAPKPNSAKIPNICNQFGVPYLTLNGFMHAEGWRF